MDTPAPVQLTLETPPNEQVILINSKHNKQRLVSTDASLIVIASIYI